MATSRELGEIEIPQISNEDVEKYKREGKILCGDTLKEVLNLVDTASYEIPSPPAIQNDSLKSEFLERVRDR
jgi:hypothetical protein